MALPYFLIILCLTLCLFSSLCAGSLLYLSYTWCVYVYVCVCAWASQQTFLLPEAPESPFGAIPTPYCAWFQREEEYRQWLCSRELGRLNPLS